ncbi:MAG: hypothetical protein OMM_09782 [Candidatus Magnetoglobus multicellularis str. Araruama]|uniref:DUF2786 domain-containing protein n=1 Tax=Candidatus Magnetoglobus multicellularis str. Araruama TaxID=890399 RepID=A0A1V1P2W5_9BACT|nr:MAG: hypothetical protein OMM_09782 [Candidatus Magnetoglobus multicellularis str. Araruama]
MAENTQKNSQSTLQTEMERRILHGLIAEWEDATYRLNTTLRIKFKKPIFSLSDMKGRWAYWSLKKREICLSRNLVMNYSWATVREILHHEMAHQLAQEVLGGAYEKSHGPTFQQACLFLRANPEASGDYPTLEDRIKSDKTTEEDRLLIRIQKLMALAESSNQHEAELAMTKANELMIRFNITFIKDNKRRSYESIFVGKPALRQSRDMRSLSILLNQYYYVECIWVAAYVLEKQKMGRVLELSGTPQNLQIAEYVYYFVRNFIESQWKKYNKKKKLSHHRRVDFAEGIIKGFQYKLKRQQRQLKRKSSPEDQALINVTDKQLTDYIHIRYPSIQTHRFSAKNADQSVINDGRRVGKQLVISKGISEKGRHSGTLMIE